MKTKLMNILIAVQAVAGLVMIGAVKIWAPVCGKMLELVSGKEVPMKCHWAGQAAIVVGILITVTAVMGLLAKQDYKKFAVVNAVAAVLLFMVFTGLIGVCASEEMRCQITAVWGKGIAAVTLATSLALLLGGKEGQIPD